MPIDEPNPASPSPPSLHGATDNNATPTEQIIKGVGIALAASAFVARWPVTVPLALVAMLVTAVGRDHPDPGEQSSGPAELPNSPVLDPGIRARALAQIGAINTEIHREGLERFLQKEADGSSKG